jgi:hypothetical protein
MRTKACKKIDDLTDEVLESCIDGSANLDNVRTLLKECIDGFGLVHETDFGDLFAESLEHLLADEPHSEEWRECWRINQEWGESIADNVNDLLK